MEVVYEQRGERLLLAMKKKSRKKEWKEELKEERKERKCEIDTLARFLPAAIVTDKQYICVALLFSPIR